MKLPRDPRWWFTGICFAAAIVGGLWVRWQVGLPYTQEDFNRIRAGMTGAEVYDLLGESHEPDPERPDGFGFIRDQSWSGDEPLTWKRGGTSITVWFEGGKVVDKGGFPH